MQGGGNSKPVIEQEILKQVQDDINLPLKRTYSPHKFFAFTLAEVLITLGIIGVVAALTIPTLISNHQKKVYVTQLKKSVNTLTNGFKLILADNGVDKLSDTNFMHHISHVAHADILDTYINKYFNVTHSEFLTYDSRSYKLIEGAHEYNYSLYCYMMKLPDGSEVCIDGNVYHAKVQVYIDTNGYGRLPNTSGLDFFSVNFDDNATLELPDNHWVHGPSSNDLCIRGGSHSPGYCFELVAKDNWEITYY